MRDTPRPPTPEQRRLHALAALLERVQCLEAEVARLTAREAELRGLIAKTLPWLVLLRGEMGPENGTRDEVNALLLFLSEAGATRETEQEPK